jgi:hypothetical protein
MKRKELIRRIEDMGCAVVRYGKRHELVPKSAHQNVPTRPAA